jgi:hypothetical protein
VDRVHELISKTPKFIKGATYNFDYRKFEERMNELGWEETTDLLVDYQKLDGRMFIGNGEVDYVLDGELISPNWCTRVIL